MIKAKSIVVCLFFLALPCLAQMDGYTASSSLSGISNFNGDCTYSDCWHTGQIVMDAVGLTAVNGYVIATDSSGYAYLYSDYPNNTWTKQTAWGSGLTDVVYDGAGTLWSLQASSSCSHGARLPETWTGTAWAVASSQCLDAFSPAADGSAYYSGIDAKANLWVSTNGVTWTEVGPANVFISSATVSASPLVYAVEQGGTVWEVNNGTLTQFPALPGSATAAKVATDGIGDAYVTDGTTNEYHLAEGATSWDTLEGPGSVKAIATMGGDNVWLIGPLTGSDTVYRFSEMGLRHTRTVAGEATNCPTGCTGVTHTITAQAGWNSVMGSQTQQQFSPATNQANVQATAGLNDPFDCLEDDNGCTPTVYDLVYCSVAGTLLSDTGAISFPASEFAITSGEVSTVTRNKVLHSNYYEYALLNNCSPSDADMVLGGNVDATLFYPTNNLAQVELGGYCFSLTGGQPWACVNYGIPWFPKDILPGQEYTTYQGPYTNCTYNF